MLSCLKQFLMLMKSNRAKSNKPSKRPLSFSRSEGGSSSNRAKSIQYAEIKHATNNFSSEQMIFCQGGFGKVYRGTLRDGTKVVVKRYEHGQDLRSFSTEPMILAQIHHPHIISFIGLCEDDECNTILVYEHMEKGALRDYLCVSDGDSSSTCSSSPVKLSWEQRLQICIDTAEAVHYLHSGGARKIIHRDVKSTSILLDENYRAKLGNFGLSRPGPDTEEEHSTVIAGTLGYIDPEYFRTSHLTEKSDVYSFGVVLLEVLCSRPAILSTVDRKEERNLAEWGVLCLKNGQLQKIIDPVLVGGTDASSLRIFCATAEKSLMENSDERPVMREILWNLELALELQLQKTANA